MVVRPVPPFPLPSQRRRGLPVAVVPVAAQLQFAIGLLFLVTFVLAAFWARFPAPYRDDWDWLRLVLAEPFSIATLFRPHNEHIIALPRWLFAMQYALEGTSDRLMFGVALAAQAMSSWMVWREVHRRWSGGIARATWGLAAVFSWSTYQLQSITFAAAVMFPLLLALTSIGACAALNATGAGRGARAWLALAALAAAAALTMTSGVAVPAVIGAIVWRRGGRPLVAAGFAAATVAAAALHVALVPSSLPHLGSFGAMAVFFLAFFGSALAAASVPLAVTVGAMVCAAVVAACTVTMAAPNRAARLEWFAVALMLFVASTAAMAAPGRAPFGAAQAAQSRYATYSLACWGALLLWGASVCDRKARPWPQGWILPAMVTAAALPVQLLIGYVWHLKADGVSVPLLAIKSGVADDEWMRALHPDPQVVYDVVRRLQDAGDRSLTDGRIGQPLPGAAAAACQGRLTLRSVTGGWRLDGRLGDDGASAVVGDREGTVRGLARPAPVVDLPDPPDAEYVRRAWTALRGGGPTGQWIGFVAEGGGAPFTLLVLEADGRPRCQLTLEAE